MRVRAATLLGMSVVALAALAPATAMATTGDAGAVSGEVFLDLDGDGTRDADEPGRADVQVSLRTAATILDATVTGADGSWTFNNVPAGPATLVVEPPIDHVVTGGTVDGLDTGSGEAAIEVDGDLAVGAIGLGSPVSSGADVAATVTFDDGASTEDNYVWNLLALNLGPGDADGPVDLRVVLNATHEVASATGDGWTCEESTAIVLCTSAAGLPGASTLPALSVTTTPVGDVGSDVTVTGTVRLDGVFDAAPLNDEAVATRAVGGDLAAADIDGDGTGDLTTAGASTTGLLVAALLALVVGAGTVTTTRSTHRP